MHDGDSRRDLGTLLRGRVPIVVVETRDEDRAVEQVLALARQTTPSTPVFTWVVTEGLRRRDVDVGPPQRFNSSPTDVLATVRDGLPGIYVLLDFHPYLTDPLTVRLLKDAAQESSRGHRTVVLVSHEVEVPDELVHLTARFRPAFPTAQERRAILDEVASEWAREHGRLLPADPRSVQLLVDNLAGLSWGDVRRLARAAIHHDGAVQPSDVPAVMKAKYDLLNTGGVLGYEYDTAGMADLGGMRRLKEWLVRRRPAFDGAIHGLEPPKGVLLLGVQGCGKSLASKVAAGVLGVPLLRLDFGAVHSKYVGESEKNLRESLATADVMAPCVLWIDELEKGMATSDSDAGTSQRVLGTFLTWLAEKQGRVFVVATANDISRLPPELVRKGRFDEIFFVDLPARDVRAEVLRIHAGRRGITLTDAEVAVLADACEGYSGSEIEQAVVSAAYAAHADGGPVGARHVLAELQATRPLSVVMGERIAELRRWAAPRTVPAD